jgi:hypothetical protein
MSDNAQTPPNPYEGVTFQVVLVTPEIAESWLAKNTHNRRLKQHNIKKFAEAMERGEWNASADCVVFSPPPNIVLLNGQNRLHAIIKSGVSVWMGVLQDVPFDSQDTMDDIAKRSISDVLDLHGEHNTSTTANALSIIHKLRTKTMRVGGWSALTPIQALQMLEHEPNIRDFVKQASANSRILRYPTGLWAALHYWFSLINVEDADVFFERLASGANLAEGDPIFHLRRKMEQDASAARRIGPLERAAVTIKAWNFWRDGAQIQRLYWTPGGARPEPFPEAR